MAQDIRYDKSHHAGATPEARIANRLRNSGSEKADHVVQKGSGPTRTITNIHNSANHTHPAGPLSRDGEGGEQ
jgi:hypothetical protein